MQPHIQVVWTPYLLLLTTQAPPCSYASDLHFSFWKLGVHFWCRLSRHGLAWTSGPVSSQGLNMKLYSETKSAKSDRAWYSSQQHLVYVLSVVLCIFLWPTAWARQRLATPACRNRVHQSYSQTKCSNLWSRNKTVCVHSHIIRKWRCMQSSCDVWEELGELMLLNKEKNKNATFATAYFSV